MVGMYLSGLSCQEPIQEFWLLLSTYQTLRLQKMFPLDYASGLLSGDDINSGKKFGMKRAYQIILNRSSQPYTRSGVAEQRHSAVQVTTRLFKALWLLERMYMPRMPRISRLWDVLLLLANWML